MATGPSRSQFKAQMRGALAVRAPSRPASEDNVTDAAPPEARQAPPLAYLAGGLALVVDPGLRCLSADGDAVRLAALGAGDIAGRPLAEVLDPALLARLEPHCRLALEGHTFAYEHEAHGRSYLSRGVPLHDAAGGIAAALVVTYDITDQQQGDALRRRSEESFSTLIEHAPLAVYVIDAAFQLRATNRAADALFADIEPLHGRDFGEIAASVWPAPLAALVVRQFRHTLATGEPYIAPPGAGAGRMDSYDWQLQRITLPDGTPGVVCYAYDVAPIREAQRALTDAAVERAKTEARLHDSETRLRLALDASGMGTFVWHLDQDRGEPDPRTLALFGLTVESPSLADVRNALVHPDDSARCAGAVARAIDPAGSGALHEDIRVRRPDGTVHWLAITARTTFAGEPRRAIRIAGVVADIDERKRREASLRAREEQLTAADRRKDEFLAVLAHELRNPLAPLRAGLELIRLSGDASPAVDRTRAIMERQVGHMVRLIDDLLDVSRITSGKIQLQRRPTPLDVLVATAVDANRQAITSARLALDVQLPDPPVWVDTDPTRSVQIISNILHNAVKFTDPGGRIAITTEVRAAEGPGTSRLALTVADSGVGISSEMLPRVFELFTQDRAANSRAQAGLGIGLALARRLIEMHGGTIEARSDGAGCGSAITITLPLSDVVASGPSTFTPPAGPRTRHRVVVVDDNVDAANAMAMLINALGAEARVGSDGPTGLAHVLEWVPALVLLDIGMPGMDGYETCRRIRDAVGHRVRVVALTGWGQEQDKREAERAGFDAHLTKPADPAALERLLAELPSAE